MTQQQPLPIEVARDVYRSVKEHLAALRDYPKTPLPAGEGLGEGEV